MSAAVEALQEVERRIEAMASSRYYCEPQEIGARDALRHVRDVIAEQSFDQVIRPVESAES